MMQYDHLPPVVRDFLRQASEEKGYAIDAFKMVKLYEGNKRKDEDILQYARRYVQGDFLYKTPTKRSVST